MLVITAAGEAIGWPFLRGPLEQQLTRRLQTAVKIDGPFHMRLVWRPQLAAARLFVANAPTFNTPHLIEAEKLQVSWRWADLWSRAPHAPWPLRQLTAQRLDAHLVRLSDGQTNWQPRAEAQTQKGPMQKEASVLPVATRHLALGSGQLSWRDDVLQTRVAAQFMLRDDANAPDAFQGRASGTWQGQPLALEAASGNVQALVGSTGNEQPLVPVFVQGRWGQTEARFRGIAGDMLDGASLNGSLLVRGPSLARLGELLGITLPDTPAYGLAGALRHRGDVWELDAADARIGRSRLAASLALQRGIARPQLTGRVNARLLRLQDLGPAIGASAPADVAGPAGVLDPSEVVAPVAGLQRTRAASPVAGRVLPDRRFDLPSLRVMNADVTLEVERLETSTDDGVEPLTALHTAIVLEDGVLTLGDLRATVAGGQLSGRTSLDATQPGRAARWDADLRMKGVRVERWVNGLRQAADGRSDTRLLSGALDLRIDVRGDGQSTADILSSLDGRASARLRDGRFSHLLIEAAGLDIAQALGVWVRGDRMLPLRCARVDASMTDGVAALLRADVDTDDSLMRLTGRVDLRDETLALRAHVRPKDFSPLSLRAPIVVGGTLAAPEVGIEGQRLAGRLLAAAALAAAAPVGALLPLLEFGDPTEAADPCAATS